LAYFADLRIERYPHEPFLGWIWDLRHNATAYDAPYLALAKVVGPPLVTRDARLASARGHAARVKVIA
jgi:predicted nucleic acid-binding protein